MSRAAIGASVRRRSARYRSEADSAAMNDAVSFSMIRAARSIAHRSSPAGARRHGGQVERGDEDRQDHRVERDR